MGFPGGSDGQESACNVGDPGSMPGLGRSPGEGHGNPLQYSCLENPHGQRSLWYYYQLTLQIMNVRLREHNSRVQRVSPAYLIMWASKTKLSVFEDLQKIIPDD